MKKLILALPVVFAALSPQWVHADDLQQVYALALEADPQLRAAEAARLAALEAKPQARAQLLPSIDAAASAARNRQDQDISGTTTFRSGTTYYDTAGYGLNLTQPVYHRDYFVQLQQADAQIAQAEAEFRSAEQDLIVRVAERYFDVLAAEDNLRFAQAEREAFGRQLEQSKKRFEVGLVAITDVHEAQAAYDQAVAQEIDAENQVDVAREALRAITGQYHEKLAPVQDPVPLIKPEPADIDQWIKTALGENLNLLAALAAAESARQEIERRRSGHYPTLDVVARHEFSDTGGGIFGSRETTDSSLGLELNVPIYQGGAISSQTQEARYLFQQATENVEQQRRGTINDTRAAYLSVLSGISRVEALKQGVVSAESALEATEAGFEVGTRTIVDVLISQRTLTQAQSNYARARYDYILTTLRLKQAAGTLAPADVEAVNQWLER
jgi:outer membrane protein